MELDLVVEVLEHPAVGVVIVPTAVEAVLVVKEILEVAQHLINKVVAVEKEVLVLLEQEELELHIQ